MKLSRISAVAVAALFVLACQNVPAGVQKALKGLKARAPRTPHATRGQVTSVSESGFDLALGGKKTPTPVTMHVTVNGSTRVVAISRGTMADFKTNDLVAALGERTSDQDVQATAILRLWPVSGEPTAADQQAAMAVVAGARSLLMAGRRMTAAPAPVAPPVTGTGSQPPAPAAPTTGPARRPRSRAMIGKVVSIAPLKIAFEGHDLTVKDPIANTGVASAITLKDLQAGDRVSVVGPMSAGSDTTQPSSIAATVVVKAATKAKKPKRTARLPK